MRSYKEYLQSHLFYVDYEQEEFSAWIGHVAFAQWLIGCLRPRLFVELGVHQGGSYIAFCQAVRNLGTGTRCYGIDTWEGDDHTGFYSSSILEKLRRAHDLHFSTFSNLIVSHFDDAADHFQDGSIDLLHIDGLHTYEAVKHDFEIWRPKLSDRAVVLFHDTDVQSRGFGVHRFWNEIREGKPHFSFHHSHGLGVLGMGAKLPESILPLFQAGEEEQALTRTYFTALSRPWVENNRLRATPPLTQFRQHLENFTSHLDELNIIYQAVVRFPSRPEQRLFKNTPKFLRAWAAGMQRNADSAFLRRTEGFDEAWYRLTYAAHPGAQADPIRHFVEKGEREGLQPNALFIVDTRLVEKYRRGLFFGSYYAACLRERKKLISRRRRTRQKETRSPAIRVPFDHAAHAPAPGSIAVVCHCYYIDLTHEILFHLENIPVPYSLYLSTDTEEKKEKLLEILKHRSHSSFEIRVCENRGRDIAPKFVTFRDVYARHEFFLHLHTKKSLHTPELGGRWRRYLYASLLGSPEIVRSIFLILGQPRVGIVYPSHVEKFHVRDRWGGNFERTRALLGKMQIKIKSNSPLTFPAGSMFWGRSDALRPLLNLNLDYRDFEEEGDRIDGMLPHAIERSICLVAGKANFRTQEIILKGHDIEDEKPVECRDGDDLPRAMARSKKITDRIRRSNFLKDLSRANRS